MPVSGRPEGGNGGDMEITGLLIVILLIVLIIYFVRRA
ncbi:hypothetical protein BH20ACT2_BH20ACT2_07510 [soil metagenome]